MSAIASPYGLRPVQLLGGGPYAGAIRTYTLTANSAVGFFFGDSVGMTGGAMKPINASPVPGGPTVDSPIGIFMGCEYVHPQLGFVNAQAFPAGGFAAGLKNIKFKILDHPGVVMRVQANGSVPATAIGLNTALVPGAGNAATGDSVLAAASAAAVGATAVKIIGFFDAPGSAPGDAFTDLLVIWNAGVHRYATGVGL